MGIAGSFIFRIDTSDHDGLLAEGVGSLFDELAFAVKWHRPSILLVVYTTRLIREAAEILLSGRLSEIQQNAVRFQVDQVNYDIPLLLSKKPDLEHSVFFMIGLSHGGGRNGSNAYRALNIRREYFVDNSLRVVLWLTDAEAVQLARQAPDFWAFRHRLVEFPASDSIRSEMFAMLGDFYRKKGDLDPSIKCLKQGIGIARKIESPGVMAHLWMILGAVYMEMLEPNRAARAFWKAARLTPLDPSVWSLIGHFYHVTRRYRDAIIAYRQVISLDPQNPLAHSALVAIYRKLGRENLATKQQQLALPAMEKQNLFHRAVFAAACGNDSLAVRLLTNALRKKEIGKEVVYGDPIFESIFKHPLLRKYL